MRKLTFAQATLEAMAEEMKKDDKVYVIGEVRISPVRAACSASSRA